MTSFFNRGDGAEYVRAPSPHRAALAMGRGNSPRSTGLAIALGAIVLGLPFASAEERAYSDQLSADGCTLERGPTGVVARVVDGDTLVLADGIEVRLIGALAARPAFALRPWRIETAGKAALETLAVGRPVELGYAGQRTNRYGHLLAQVFVATGEGERIWVQAHLIEQGFARVYGLLGNFGCMAELQARERIARKASVGLWSDKAFAPVPVEPARDLLRRQSTFQVVRGEVRKVERVKDRVYLNFGEDWRQDFTAGATIGADQPSEDWTRKLSALQGRVVEVRGWIERRNGPFIEIWDASQIETVQE